MILLDIPNVTLKASPAGAACQLLWSLAKDWEVKGAPFLVYAAAADVKQSSYIIELDERYLMESNYRQKVNELLDTWGEQIGLGIFPIKHEIWSTDQQTRITISAG